MSQLTAVGTYFIGQKPLFTARFFAASTGVLTDPTTVKFISRNPAGTETVYTYGSSSEVTKTSTGVFTFALPQLSAAHAGSWLLRVNATGTVVTSGEVTFECLDSEYTTPLP